MKKLCLALATCATLGMNFNAMADNHTFSLGFEQGKISDINDINGINIKYRYEWDSPISIITSFSYMGGSKSLTEKQMSVTNHEEFKSKYYSLAVGPAYRFNEFVSIYGLAGFSFNKLNYIEKNVHDNSNRTSILEEASISNTSFMYGAGIQINPIENISIDLGYEGSRLELLNGYSKTINSFNIGVGYRF